MTTDLAADNPFATPSTLPYGLPDHARIREEHYRPALLAGMAEQRAEIEAIAVRPRPSRRSRTRSRRSSAPVACCTARPSSFFNQSSSDSSPGLDAIEEEISPLLAAHHDAIYLDPRLFARVEALKASARGPRARHRVAARAHAHPVRPLGRGSRRGVAGPPARAERRDQLPRDRVRPRPARRDERRGGPGDGRATSSTGWPRTPGWPPRRPPATAGYEHGWLLELELPTQQAPLSSLTDRALRERVYRASIGRGAAGDEHDTRATLLGLARKRAERAQLLGYAHHAEYVAADATAKTAEAVADILEKLAPAAVANAQVEAAELAEALGHDHPDANLEPWDWAFYAEQVKKEKRSLERGPAAALPRARAGARRRGVPGRERALRPDVRRAARPGRLPPRRARLRGLRRRRHRARPVPRRLLDAGVEARRRLDEQPGRPVDAPGRAAPSS